MRIREEWCPLRIEGAWDRGMMMVGNSYEAAFQIKWWRPGKARFNAAAWLNRRARQVGGAAAELSIARPAGVTDSRWVPSARIKGGGEMSIWYGWAPAGRVVLEVTVNGAVSEQTQRFVTDQVLPTITVTSEDEATRWAVFEIGFVSPPGFRIVNRYLKSGDMALRFSGPDRALLTVRQVYPASIAQDRRPLEKWLDAFPKSPGERRCYRASGAARPWRVEAPTAGAWEGLCREGRKVFAWPLAGLASRVSVAAGVVDGELDRLLLAEDDRMSSACCAVSSHGRGACCQGAGNDARLAQAIGGMNWTVYA